MAREWSGIASALPRKLFTLLFCLLFVGIGNAWGTTYTYTPGGTYSASGGTSTINGVKWTYSSATYCSLNSSKIQIGSKNNPQTSNWTIQTAISNFGSGKKVTAISLTAYTTATTATYDISAGGASVKSGSLTTSSNTYTASSLNVTSGNIVITMKGSSTSKAMYLCGISVTYEDAGGGCTAPTITAQPTGATYTQNDVATAMSITASGTSVTYQWYSNTSNSTSGASPISGATSSSYTPPTSTVGTKYYYCVASSSTCTTISNIVSVVVNAPRYTVSFSTGTGNPTQANIQEASGGSGITLPSGPTPACSSDGWNFAGWGYESCDDESTEPTLYIAGNKYYPSSNETLYAVYVKGKTASTNYKLISDAAQIVSGENYVIAAYYNSNDYAITAEIQSSYYIKQTAVTVTENVISSPGAKIIWQLTNEGGSNVSLYNSNQSKYLYVYASSSYRNLGLYDSKKQFTMTEEREAGYASTFAFNSTDYTSYYINYDASHTDFGTKTSSDENLYLYKRQYTGTYESNPTCCTPLGSINGSFF